MNKELFKSFLLITFIFAIFISAIIACFGNPIIAILGSTIITTVMNRYIFAAWWDKITELKIWQKWTIAAIAALIGSQMGWIALLI